MAGSVCCQGSGTPSGSSGGRRSDDAASRWRSSVHEVRSHRCREPSGRRRLVRVWSCHYPIRRRDRRPRPMPRLMFVAVAPSAPVSTEQRHAVGIARRQLCRAQASADGVVVVRRSTRSEPSRARSRSCGSASRVRRRPRRAPSRGRRAGRTRSHIRSIKPRSVMKRTAADSSLRRSAISWRISRLHGGIEASRRLVEHERRSSGECHGDRLVAAGRRRVDADSGGDRDRVGHCHTFEERERLAPCGVRSTPLASDLGDLRSDASLD